MPERLMARMIRRGRSPNANRLVRLARSPVVSAFESSLCAYSSRRRLVVPGVSD